jgi:alpha-methylacyl-CoA racemase
MLLADLGADVIRIERPGGSNYSNSVIERGRSSMTLDIRTPEGRETALAIADKADVLVEGMRPGVMERLGLGPEVICKRNPRIVYGRMTGWGQSGKLAKTAGHDINYIALTGALAAMGRPNLPPPPPLNLVGDFGGGSLYLAFGIMAALWERERSGQGQVIDAAIIDGVASMMSMFTGLSSGGSISVDRERSSLGGAAPSYRCYECADGKYVSVGALEPQFYTQLLCALGVDEEFHAAQDDVSSWQEIGGRLERIFRQRTRDEWCTHFENTDCCFAPVLSLEEAPRHKHMAERGTYIDCADAIHPAPAPRFSRTPGSLVKRKSGSDMLLRWGVLPSEPKLPLKP